MVKSFDVWYTKRVSLLTNENLGGVMKKVIIVLATAILVIFTLNVTVDAKEIGNVLLTGYDKTCDAPWDTVVGAYENNNEDWRECGDVYFQSGFEYDYYSKDVDAIHGHARIYGPESDIVQVWNKDADGNIDYDKENYDGISSFYTGAKRGNDYSSYNSYARR